MVAVADTGTGIPADILDKVFDPFFTTKEVGKGSGLGLSQVMGVAQQLGGSVRIDTRVGEGTTVHVYLPRVPVSSEARKARRRPPRPADGPDSQRRGELILLVDDDSDVRAVAAGMLDEAGYQVIEAGSGGAALECLEYQAGDVSLMIADIAMPGMSGIELAHAARLAQPDLPILFITGYAGAGLPPADAGREAAPDRLLRKPFRAAELVAQIAATLEEQGKRTALV